MKLIRNSARIILVVVLLFALYSCSDNHKSIFLETELLLDKDSVEAADLSLRRIISESGFTAEDSARYQLNQFIIDYKLSRHVSCDLNSCIRYYKEIGDKGHFAKAYFYKGLVSLNAGNEECAYKYLMLAASMSRNGKILFDIYDKLCDINLRKGTCGRALYYEKNASKVASSFMMYDKVASSFFEISIIYSAIGCSDSSSLYVEKAINSLSNLPKSLQALQLDSFANKITDFEEKEYFFKRSIDLYPLNDAYNKLASIYYIKGDSIKAKVLWNRAYISGNYNEKMQTLRSQAKAFCSAREYKKQSELLKKIIIELEKQRLENSEHYVYVQSQNKATALHILNEYFVVLVLLVFLSLFIFIFLRTKLQKSVRIIYGAMSLISTCIEKVKIQKEELIDYSEKICSLNKEVLLLSDKHNNMLAKGKINYEHIENGGNIVRWSKEDLECYIYYYKICDLEFVTLLENDYTHLSLKNMFFMILYHIGKTDEDVKNIMGIEQGSIRSTRLRIRQKYIK